jgi:hypothetical protein
VCAACVCCILLCVCVCVCVCAVIVRCAVSSMCLPMAHPVLLLRERGLTPVPYSDAHIVSCSRLLLVDEDFEAREHGNQWQFYTVLHSRGQSPVFFVVVALERLLRYCTLTHSRGQSPVFFVVVALERLQPLEKRSVNVVQHSRDKSLFLPLDTNEIGVKYEQRELYHVPDPGSLSTVQFHS